MLVVLSNRLPFSERAGFGRHAKFRPGRASALATAARAVECLRVPFGTGAARCFAGGEGFGWRDRCAVADEAMRGVAEASEHLGTAFGYMRREGHVKTKLGITKGSSGFAG